MHGPGRGLFEGLWHIAALFGGLVLAVALLALAVLLVRYLIVATRAAQLYVDAHSAPGEAPAATEPPPATTPAPGSKPAPRPRTPKDPPAAL